MMTRRDKHACRKPMLTEPDNRACGKPMLTDPDRHAAGVCAARRFLPVVKDHEELCRIQLMPTFGRCLHFGGDTHTVGPR